LAIVWERTAKKYILKGHTKEIKQVFLSDDAKKAFTVSSDETAKIWMLDIKDYSIYREEADKIRFNPKTNSYVYKDGEDVLNLNIAPEYIIKIAFNENKLGNFHR
jgi:hypothetical protein